MIFGHGSDTPKMPQTLSHWHSDCHVWPIPRASQPQIFVDVVRHVRLLIGISTTAKTCLTPPRMSSAEHCLLVSVVNVLRGPTLGERCLHSLASLRKVCALCVWGIRVPIKFAYPPLLDSIPAPLSLLNLVFLSGFIGNYREKTPQFDKLYT